MTVGQDEALLLGALAHIRVLLEDAGICVRHGIILYLEDGEKMDSVLRDLEEYGMVACQLQRREKLKYPNYTMAVVPFSRFDVAVKLQDFLECKEFLPSILVCGVLPDFFEGQKNIVLLKSVKTESDDSLCFEDFKDFVHENAIFVCDWILKFLTSVRYKEMKNAPEIRVALEVTAYILANVYRQNHDEQTTLGFLYRLQKIIANMCQTDICEYHENVSGAVVRCIRRHLDKNQNVKFRELSLMWNEMRGKVEGGEIILYDTEFYYISDGLLRMLCEGLQESISYLAVKAALYREGTLVNNRAEKQNYTVKLTLCDPHGKAVRIRVIRLKRAVLDGNGGLALMERRECVCTSGNVKRRIFARSRNSHQTEASKSQAFQAQERPAK